MSSFSTAFTGSTGTYNLTYDFTLGGLVDVNASGYNTTYYFIYTGMSGQANTSNLTEGILYSFYNITKTNTTIDASQNTAGGNLELLWNDTTGLAYATYNVSFNNTDFTAPKVNALLDLSISTDWTQNTTNPTVNFTASEVKTYQINASSKKPHTYDVSTTTTSLTYQRRYDIDFTINMSSTDYKTYNLTVPIPISYTTDWASAATIITTADNVEEGVGYTTNASHVLFKVYDNYNSGSLDKGQYSGRLRYYVSTSPASPGSGTGGGGGEPSVITVIVNESNRSFSLSPRTVDPKLGDIPAPATLGFGQQMEYVLKSKIRQDQHISIRVVGMSYILESGRKVNSSDFVLVSNKTFVIAGGDEKKIVLTGAVPMDAAEKYYAEVVFESDSGFREVVQVWMQSEKFVKSMNIFDSLVGFLSSDFYSYTNTYTGIDFIVKIWHIIVILFLVFNLYSFEPSRGRKSENE